jgi:hypothetical protein
LPARFLAAHCHCAFSSLFCRSCCHVRIAHHAHRSVLSGRSCRYCRRPAGRAALEKDRALCRTGLAGVGRLHGPGQLGDVDPGRFAIRLSVAVCGDPVESGGDCVAVPVDATGHCDRQGSGRALRRAVRQNHRPHLVGAGGNCDRGVRLCRSAGQRIGVQIVARRVVAGRRAADRVRYADHSGLEGQGLPPDRGDHPRPDHHDCGVPVCGTAVRQSGLARGAGRCGAVVAGDLKSGAVVSGDRHPRCDGDAAQPVSAFVRGADARGGEER